MNGNYTVRHYDEKTHNFNRFVGHFFQPFGDVGLCVCTYGMPFVLKHLWVFGGRDEKIYRFFENILPLDGFSTHLLHHTDATSTSAV